MAEWAENDGVLADIYITRVTTYYFVEDYDKPTIR